MQNLLFKIETIGISKPILQESLRSSQYVLEQNSLVPIPADRSLRVNLPPTYLMGSLPL